MVSIVEAIVWLFILAIASVIYWYWSIPKNLPPGPLGLPFIGSSIEYWDASTQHLKLQENVKKYGPIFKFYIANKLVVVLGDYDTIQEAMIKQGDVFAGRPNLQPPSLLPKKYVYLRGKGVIFSEGNVWKEHRRFALSTLRDFGVGRPLLESKIKEEVDYLVDRIASCTSNGQPFDPQRLVTCAVSNVINQLVFGKRFS